MPASHDLTIDGHKLIALKVNNCDTGTPVILLHGVTLSAHVWLSDTVFTHYEAGPCFALSLPGHYPATFPANFSSDMFSTEMMVKVLGAAINQLAGAQPVILVGHSTGGFAALALAAFKPELAQGVVSLAGFAQGKWIGVYGLNQRLAAAGPVGRFLFKVLFPLGTRSRLIYRHSWRSVVYDTRAYYAYPDLDRVIDNTYPYAKRLDMAAMVPYFVKMRQIDITPQLPNITAPTLVVSGDKDPTVPPAQAQHIAQHVTNSRMVIVKEAGHMLFVENPAEYSRILSGWLFRE